MIKIMKLTTLLKDQEDHKRTLCSILSKLLLKHSMKWNELVVFVIFAYTKQLQQQLNEVAELVHNNIHHAQV